MSLTNRHPNRRSIVLTLLGSLGALWSSHTSAQTKSDFFRGKTIRLVVSTTAGGGYDIRARIMARYFSRYVPGDPDIVVENMPGAGSVVAMNYIYNVAPRDGTVMCLFQRSIFVTPFLTPDRVRFDLQKYNWLGSLGSENGVVVVRDDAPAKTTADLFTTELITGMPSGVTVIPNVFNAIIGTKFKIIAGYPGNAELVAALERGEIQAVGEWSWDDLKTTKADWLKTGKVRTLLQIGTEPAPDLPDTPLAQKFAKTADDRRIIEIFVSERKLAFPLVLPPEVPEERVAALRDAFIAMGRDPQFRADIAKGGMRADLTSGAQAAAFVHDTFGSLSPELAARINSLAQ